MTSHYARLPATREGYVYAPDENVGLMSSVCVGEKVALPERRPPWIVVDHSINRIIVTRWPGKLWRVEIVDAEGIKQASANAWYTRSFEVKILEEIPAWRIFGERGEAVSEIIAISARLGLPQTKLLAGMRHQDAGIAYSRAWNTWLTAVGSVNAFGVTNLEGTLGTLGGGVGSPINCGLTVLHRTISNRAEKLVGPSAFIVDEDGDEYLEPTWRNASNALLEAAMAFGAHSVPDADREILTVAWRAVFGFDPGNEIS